MRGEERDLFLRMSCPKPKIILVKVFCTFARTLMKERFMRGKISTIIQLIWRGFSKIRLRKVLFYKTYSRYERVIFDKRKVFLKRYKKYRSTNIVVVYKTSR